MKKVLLSLLSILFTISIHSQPADTTAGPWKLKGLTTLTLSQVSLVNWSQGGDNSLAINGLALLSAAYSKEKNSWVNTLDMGYGFQKVENQTLGKTDDHLDFVSRYGYKTGKNWFLSGMLNFKTQFAPGYKGNEADRTLISDFMSPGYLLLSLGMEYKPNDRFFVMLSPIGAKSTFVLNDSLSAKGSFGVDPGENYRVEMGASARIAINQEIMKNVTLVSSLDLFSNLLEKPQNIDVNWKVLINMKINEILTANVSTTLIYDDNVSYIDNLGGSHGARAQFKELLGIGLAVKFGK